MGIPMKMRPCCLSPVHAHWSKVIVLLANANAACDPGSSPSSAGVAAVAHGGGGASASDGAQNAASGSAGAPVASSSEAGAPSCSGNFVLSWQDDFDSFNPSLWSLQTHSWEGNLAQFTAANAQVSNGMVTIQLTPEPADTVKPFRGVEMRSIKTLTYGKVEARIRFAKGSAVVSGLVTISTPWPADDWNEIDFEQLGKASDTLQTSCQVYTGPPTQKPVTTSVTPARFEQIISLGFNAQGDFHVYSLEWTPVEVKFLADGQVIRSFTQESARMKLPQNILFTIWASNAPGWVGAVDDTTAPTSADMDWIKVYDCQ
jgi:beta-glucanase (GH16 family)